MPSKPLNTDGRRDRFLLVEGADDFHFLGHFLEYHGLEKQFTLEALGGFPKLQESIEIRLKPRENSAFEHIGIIVDADADVSGRWTSLRHLLMWAGYGDVPEAPQPGGTIVTQEE